MFRRSDALGPGSQAGRGAAPLTLRCGCGVYRTADKPRPTNRPSDGLPQSFDHAMRIRYGAYVRMKRPREVVRTTRRGLDPHPRERVTTQCRFLQPRPRRGQRVARTFPQRFSQPLAAAPILYMAGRKAQTCRPRSCGRGCRRRRHRVRPQLAGAHSERRRASASSAALIALVAMLLSGRLQRHGRARAARWRPGQCRGYRDGHHGRPEQGAGRIRHRQG